MIDVISTLETDFAQSALASLLGQNFKNVAVGKLSDAVALEGAAFGRVNAVPQSVIATAALFLLGQFFGRKVAAFQDAGAVIAFAIAHQNRLLRIGRHGGKSGLIVGCLFVFPSVKSGFLLGSILRSSKPCGVLRSALFRVGQSPRLNARAVFQPLGQIFRFIYRAVSHGEAPTSVVRDAAWPWQAGGVSHFAAAVP